MPEDIPIHAWREADIAERLAALGIENPEVIIAIGRTIVRELADLRTNLRRRTEISV